MIGLDEGSREKAAGKEICRKAFLFPSPSGLGWIVVQTGHIPDRLDRGHS
jgi:hypothetical protein